MKILKTLMLITVIITFFFVSCKNNSEVKKNEVQKVITNKIMYDVPIVNDLIGDRSKENPDWFWSNIPDKDCDDFLKYLMDKVKNGEIEAAYFDMFDDYEKFNIIPKDEIKSYLDENLKGYTSILDTTGNTSEVTYMKIDLDYNNIKNIRFLEEWYMEKDEFKKRVIAYAPVFSADAYNSEPYNVIAFWIPIK